MLFRTTVTNYFNNDYCYSCTVSGVIFVAIFAFAATHIASHPSLAFLGISPVVIALLLGMFYANSLHNSIPDEWVPGLAFSAKKLLRLAIILYGFRVTLQGVVLLGFEGLSYVAVMLVGTMFVGLTLGRLLKMDSQTSTLTTSGAAICGASAVLSVEGVLKSEPYKATIAVATVVIFGTLFMFALPYAYENGWIELSDHAYGVMVGTITHEVAQVAAIASELPLTQGADAVLAKMARVLMLAPLLIILSLIVSMKNRETSQNTTSFSYHALPWYAFGFIGIVVIHSLFAIPKSYVDTVIKVDDFLIAMSMTAIGMETTIEKVKMAGARPLLLGFLIAVWLLVGGYLLAKLILM